MQVDLVRLVREHNPCGAADWEVRCVCISLATCNTLICIRWYRIGCSRKYTAVDIVPAESPEICREE